MSIRFSESDVRSMGRAAGGVKGITLEKGDEVVAQAVVIPDAALLVAGENGIGKRTSFDEYLVQSESGTRRQSRGGKGRITMKVGEKTGGVIGALTVRDMDEIMLITVGGQMVRTFVKDIREAGRNTMGVKLVNLDPGDKLQAIAPVIMSSRKRLRLMLRAEVIFRQRRFTTSAASLPSGGRSADSANDGRTSSKPALRNAEASPV